MKNLRLERVNTEIRRELGVIIDNKLRDPQIDSIISVMEVKTAPDLSICHVYISCIGETHKEEVLNRIKGAGGFLRSELAKSLNLRITPRLEFHLDNSMEYGSKIDNILNNISYSTKEDDNFDGKYDEVKKSHKKPWDEE